MSHRKDMLAMMKGVFPYVAVNNCTEVLAFYEKAFGATPVGEHARTEDGRIMNATIAVNGGVMMLMDAFPEIGTEGAPVGANGLTFQLIVDDADPWWDRAVAAGCEITHPLKLEFWGDRYGRLRDPFGLSWAINEPAGKE